VESSNWLRTDSSSEAWLAKYEIAPAQITTSEMRSTAMRNVRAASE